VAPATPRGTMRGPCNSDGVSVLDIVFVVGILALVALVALVGKGVEKL
jgi:hypothetical protein